jgi:hypothetical protein
MGNIINQSINQSIDQSVQQSLIIAMLDMMWKYGYGDTVAMLTLRSEMIRRKEMKKLPFSQTS